MEKDKKKKVIVIVISILIVLILLLALTYAYFSTQLSGTDQIVKVGELELVLDETSEGITLDNAVGISDSKGMALDGSTFELINNGSNAVDYTIYLDDNTIGDTDTRIDDKYLKYNLVKNGESSGATLLTSIGSNPNRILDSGTIEGKSTNEYSLNLWITDEVDGDYSGQVFSGKLRVEVSQTKPKAGETILAGLTSGSTYDDGTDTFITGTDPNNYIWYSGKLWRAVSVNNEEKTTKLVTQWNISAINYDNDSSAFEGSYMQQWLNDTTVDGFLGNLREPKKFIKMDSEWNASQMNDASKPPSKEEGGTIVEDAVGLLNRYEYDMGGAGKSYLNNGFVWYTITPATASLVFSINNVGEVVYHSRYFMGIRPSINLLSNVEIISGNGSRDNPYRLEEDNDKNLKGTKLNTRYSGEYISFGTGENNLYRIVSHETPGLTKITSAEPLKENGAFKKIAFGNTYKYSSTNTIGSFLNGEYLNNYIGEMNINLVNPDTIWYLGNVNSDKGYKLSKYQDEISNILTSNTTIATVGLLRYGELLLSQVNENNTTYWTLTTAMNGGRIYNIDEENSLTYNLTQNHGIKPALNLKSNVVITGGTGTKSDPFTLELSS